MASKETLDLLAEAERLHAEIGAESKEAELRFGEAVERLERLPGRSPQLAGSALEDLVFRVLSQVKDAVVSRNPRAPGARYRPDFLFRKGDHTYVIEVRSGTGLTRWRSVGDDMEKALGRYGAEAGIIVVPDRAFERSRNEFAHRETVKIVRLAGLISYLDSL